MVAPSPTARTEPTGSLLENGFSTLITLASDVDIDFWEKNVQPPGIDGGDSIDVSTMHNSTWRTRAPSALLDLTEITCTVGYDPAVYDQIIAVINTDTTITVTFSDGATVAFYGYLRSFEPSDASEGEMPEATVTFTPTNRDSSGDEEAPVYTAAP